MARVVDIIDALKKGPLDPVLQDKIYRIWGHDITAVAGYDPSDLGTFPRKREYVQPVGNYREDTGLNLTHIVGKLHPVHLLIRGEARGGGKPYMTFEVIPNIRLFTGDRIHVFKVPPLIRCPKKVYQALRRERNAIGFRYRALPSAKFYVDLRLGHINAVTTLDRQIQDFVKPHWVELQIQSGT